MIHVNPNIFPQIKEIVDFQADLIVKNIFPGLIIQVESHNKDAPHAYQISYLIICHQIAAYAPKDIILNIKQIIILLLGIRVLLNMICGLGLIPVLHVLTLNVSCVVGIIQIRLINALSVIQDII